MKEESPKWCDEYKDPQEIGKKNDRRKVMSKKAHKEQWSPVRNDFFLFPQPNSRCHVK